MASPLLVPVAFTTLLGLCPACLLEATPTPATATVPAAPNLLAPQEAAVATVVVDPASVVIVATARSGNARAPSYDDGAMGTKGARVVRAEP